MLPKRLIEAIEIAGAVHARRQREQVRFLKAAPKALLDAQLKRDRKNYRRLESVGRD